MSSSSFVQEPLRLPDFDLPFARAIHPSADAVVTHTIRWAHDIELASDDVVSKLKRDGIIHAGPRLVPTAPFERACLVSDWTLFLIILDDEFDGKELGSRPDLAEPVIGEILSGRGGGTGRALTDLRLRFSRVAPSPEWLPRFSSHADDHIRSKVTEAQQRASGSSLDVPGYITLRRVTGAPYAYADLAEVAAPADIPAGVRNSRQWQDLLDAFADVFLAIQDICSCAKEVAEGDDLNLAIATQRAERCTLQEAVERANTWLGERARSFAESANDVVVLCDSLRLDAGDVTRCVDAFDALLGGHLAWNSEDNPRYTM